MERPTMLGILYRKNTQFTLSAKIRKKIARWTEYTPMVQQLMIIKEADARNQIDRYDVGLCVTSEDGDILGLHADEDIFMMEKKQCVYLTLRAINELSLIAEGYMQKILNWLNDHHFELDGDILCSTLIAMRDDKNNLLHYQRVWVPIREKND